MKRRISVLLVAWGLISFGLVPSTWAIHRGARHASAGAASGQAWHGAYYHTMWGSPVALLVPPTAERQVHWGWGVGNTRVTPIYPQFSPGYAVPGPSGPMMLYPTPPWPSDTDQFGVNYVRGPW